MANLLCSCMGGAYVILLIAAVLPDIDIKLMTMICKDLGLAALMEMFLLDLPELEQKYRWICISRKLVVLRTAEIMSDFLAYEADRRAVNITIYSIWNDVLLDQSLRQQRAFYIQKLSYLFEPFSS